MPRPIPADLPQAEIIDTDALAADLRRGKYDLVVVLGPTASGKTRYAVSLASRLSPSEIISADSRQVYRGMDIGTGKDLSDYGDLPYHLIDIVPAGSQYNVHRYQEDFSKAWLDIRRRGAVPILCGGTGLYINAVTSGYDFRTSKPLSSEGSAGECSVQLPSRPFFIGTLVGREERNARIDARLDARLEGGMVEEICSLLDSGVPAESLISYGLEYKFVTMYVLGQISLDRMRDNLAIAIHQFAKRQMTWFRGMERAGTRIHWVAVPDLSFSNGTGMDTPK